MKTLQRNLILTGIASLFSGTASAQIQLGSATHFGTGIQPSGMAMADFNGDGRIDLATTTDNPDKVEILAGNGAGGFALAQTVLLGSGVSPEMLIARDVDGDGDADLAVTLKDSNAVRLVINNGGSMSLGGLTGVGGLEPRGIASGDFNGNGTLDFVTANRGSNNMSVLMGNGGGGLALAQVLAAGADPRDAAAGDFNGDGLDDIAISAHDDRNVNVFQSNGGTFGGFTSLSVGGQRRPSGVTAADVNGDGLMDILAATSGTGFNSVTVFLSTGGAFSGPFHYAVGGINPSGIATADLDLDGDRDVVVSNEDSNNISALPNLGGGAFGAPVIVAVGTRPEGIDLADVDGNGSPDIGVANRDSNNVSVILNGASGGPTTYCIAAPNSVGAGTQIGSIGSVSIAANDFTLTASSGPAGQPYVFYYGDMQLEIPFGDGFRCVGGTTARLNPPATFSPAGNASRLVDFTSGPAASGPAAITAGSTWNFQCWYRDPLALGAGFNLSNALNATFQP